MDREITPAPPAPPPAAPTHDPGEYRAPLLIPIGAAVELLQRDGSGHLIDGTGGWWVWGS